ncbi:MAG: hypothetical protein H6639_03765 [Caldilineaceae bacterium]|nr:hypothetical protein [Caldilineaceae bacterium]
MTPAPTTPATWPISSACVQPVALADTLAQAAASPDGARDAFIERVTALAPNVAELDQAAVRGTAGVYHALRTLADDSQLSGVAVRCWPEFFTELGCAACGAMSVLNEEKCPAAARLTSTARSRRCCFRR